MCEGIPDDHAPFVGKVRVHGAWGIRDVQALLERRSASRPDLRLAPRTAPRIASVMRSIACYSLTALTAVTMTPPAHGADPLMAPGVSRELARNRAAILSNVRYEMALSLARRDTARGTVTVRFTAARSADVVLDFRGPWLDRKSVV